MMIADEKRENDCGIWFFKEFRETFLGGGCYDFLVSLVPSAVQMIQTLYNLLLSSLLT